MWKEIYKKKKKLIENITIIDIFKNKKKKEYFINLLSIFKYSTYLKNFSMCTEVD